MIPHKPPHPLPGAAAPLRFRHVAIVGKYQALGSRDALDGIAHFLHDEGCDVAMERDTAHNTGLMQYGALGVEEIGARCDLALVVGGFFVGYTYFIKRFHKAPVTVLHLLAKKRVRSDALFIQ